MTLHLIVNSAMCAVQSKVIALSVRTAFGCQWRPNMNNKVTLRYESCRAYNCKSHEEVWFIKYGTNKHTSQLYSAIKIDWVLFDFLVTFV